MGFCGGDGGRGRKRGRKRGCSGVFLSFGCSFDLWDLFLMKNLVSEVWFCEIF